MPTSAGWSATAGGWQGCWNASSATRWRARRGCSPPRSNRTSSTQATSPSPVPAMHGLTTDDGHAVASRDGNPLSSTVLADLGQAVATVSPLDGRILWANAACERLFGYAG